MDSRRREMLGEWRVEIACQENIARRHASLNNRQSALLQLDPPARHSRSGRRRHRDACTPPPTDGMRRPS